MTFHITYQLSPERRNDAQKRFKGTGAPPPSGVTMTGRWHCAQGLRGFVVAETSDAEAIAKWLQEWTDLLSFEVTPVVSDEQLGRVIGWQQRLVQEAAERSRDRRRPEPAVPAAPAWLQRAGLGADVMGPGATQRGSEGVGVNVDALQNAQAVCERAGLEPDALVVLPLLNWLEYEESLAMASTPLRPDDPAPHFALPAVNREGQVSLDDYRGRSPLLLGLFRGLHWPFCRRPLVQLGTTQEKLKAVGVETVAVVNTPLERARLYFKYRPARVLLAADPEAKTHRAFGVPAGVIVEDESATSWPQSATMGQLLATKVNPTGELPEALPEPEAAAELNRREGFQPTEIDQQIEAAHGTQLAGHFLMDREGIIRWRQIEAAERIDDLGKFPSDEEILRAARGL